MSLWDNERVERYIRLYGDPREKKGSQSALCSDIVSLMIGGSVADFACGMGHLAAYIEEDRSYLGLDLSEEMLERARSFFPDKIFIRVDITKNFPPAIEQFYDNTVAVSISLHLERTEAYALYRSMWEHTSPGGRMIFSMETNGDNMNRRPDGLLIRNQLVEDVIEDVQAITKETVNTATQKKTIQIIQEIYQITEKVNIVGLSQVSRTTIFWVNKV